MNLNFGLERKLVNSVNQILEFVLLNEFSIDFRLKRFCAKVYGMSLDSFWYICDVFGEQKEWSFLKKRQLFLELVAYNLIHKNIKFGEKVYIGDYTLTWDESLDIEIVIAYLEKGFTKFENEFNHGVASMKDYMDFEIKDLNDCINTVLNDSIKDYKLNKYGYFFAYCPILAYWHNDSSSWIWTS